MKLGQATLWTVAMLGLLSTASAADLAAVGDVRISDTDVANRVATEGAYGNPAVSDTAALVTLVNDALERAVAMKVGQDATPEEIAALARHADETSKAPEILARVKAVYGPGESFDRWYLAPRVVNGKLRAYFSSRPELQSAQRARAEAVLAAVLGGQALAEAAASAGLEVQAFELQSAPSSEPTTVPLPVIAPSLKALLDGLQMGGVLPTLYEDGASFSVVRLVAKTPKTYQVEMVSVPGRSFDDWLHEAATGLSLRVTAGALLSAVRGDYPQLWWLALVSE